MAKHYFGTFVDWLANASQGDEYFTQQKDKSLTAIANRFNCKIKTERWIAIHPATRQTKELTKVTFICHKDNI